MKKKTHIPSCFLKPLLGLSLLAVLASPVCAVEAGASAATPSPDASRFENTYTMPLVWRNLYAKALNYATTSNLPELEREYILGSKIDGNTISFSCLSGYECSGEASYTASPDGIYELHMAGNWTVKSTQAIDLGDEGIYVTCGPDPGTYKSSGFPAMPDLYYSLAANGDCYLNQRTLGYPMGCCPTALSMAMMLSGEPDFDYTGFFAALKQEGYLFKTRGITLSDALDSLSRYADLSGSCLYLEYNPFAWMNAVLDGHPVVICVENGIRNMANSRFLKPYPAGMNGYHAELITGFFVCSGRLGFELYDPDPCGTTGQGVLIWESDLWSLCRNEVNGGFFSAISFRLNSDGPAEREELTLKEKGKLNLMYNTMTICTRRQTFEDRPFLVDTVNGPVPTALVS